MKKPEIRFEYPKNELELETPKLDSFYFDNRIIVKVIGRARIKYDVKGIADFNNIEENFSFKYFSKEIIISRRAYFISTLKTFEIRRYPIVWAVEGEISEINKFAALAFGVLTNQLETWTSSRIIYECLNYLKSLEGTEQNMIEDFNNKFNRIVRKNFFYEGLVAEAVVKNWLIKKHLRDKNFSAGDILNWHLKNAECGQLIKILKKINREGCEEILKYYSSKQFPEFLKNYLR